MKLCVRAGPVPIVMAIDLLAEIFGACGSEIIRRVLARKPAATVVAIATPPNRIRQEKPGPAPSPLSSQSQQHR